MKRMLFLGLILSLAAGAAFGSIMFKVTSFSPSDASFKSIYGGGLTYGVELSFELVRGVDFWVGAGTFSKKGKTSYTQEVASLSLIPVSGGLKWRILPDKNVSPYIALGAVYVLYKETSVIGNVSAGGVGFIGRGGVLFQVASFLGIDAHVVYSFCSMQPADFKFGVGGIEVGGGIAVIF
jgi:hypothetical protein